MHICEFVYKKGMELSGGAPSQLSPVNKRACLKNSSWNYWK